MENNSQLKKFDFVIIILSFYVLITLIIDIFFKMPDELNRLLSFIDDAICLVFLYDFFQRLFTAKSKLQFMKWGWIDLLSSIPAFNIFRYGRVVRLFRLLRLLRAFRSIKYLTNHLLKNRKQGTFATVAILTFIMLIFGSIAILQVENDPGSNIKTAEDAIWWAFVTITTVGYGDKFPVTTEGRIVAAALMITGIGLIGTFTGFITAWFMGADKNEETNE